MTGKRERAEVSPAAIKKLAAAEPLGVDLSASSERIGRPIAMPLTAISLASSAAASGTCAICRSPLVQRCTSCVCAAAADGAAPRTSCSLVFGRCGCVFHLHCLEPWTLRQFSCPVHEVAWEETQPSMALCAARP